MTTPLTLAPSRRPDGTPVLTVGGEIDMSNAREFDAALTRAEEAGENRQDGGVTVLVDLTEVGYLDSAGLTVLFAHAPRIELVANELLAPVLTISGLANVTTIHGLGG